MIDAKAFGQAARTLRDAGDVFDDASENAQARIADAVEGRIAAAASRHGMRGTKTTKRGSGVDRRTSVSINDPLAHLVIPGTRAHAIRPRRARALRLAVGGSVRFAEGVQVRGIRSDPIVTNAIDDSEAEISAILDREGDRITGELAARIRKGTR